MDNLRLFLKENKTAKENVFYRATESLRGEDNEPLLWEIRRITTREDERLRDECMSASKGFDYNLYIKKLAAASVVTPCLYNAELQDSYGVKTPEDLLEALIDSPGEYQEFVRFVQKTNGFDVTMSERVERAKN